MNRLHAIFVMTIAFSAWLAGCAPKEPPPVERIYAGLAERPEAFAADVLAGKRIVIDPGHGGSFDGTLGADSLREADANLGVALYLWGLCADAGADVQLTRSSDRDRLPPGSTEARDDLRARVERANELEPDIFVSIHHNSNLRLDRSLNKIEVYYRSSDTGPSLELAQAIQVHLFRNLGIPEAEVKPGNYYVLRNSTAHAAVLGEASFLSHPLVEDRLRLAEKQKLEAYAYFFGFVDYFSRGVPVVARLAPAADTISAPAEIVFAARPDAGVPLDPVSARIRIGAEEYMAHCTTDSSIIRWPMGRDLPNGPHAVEASVRSARGATGRSTPFTLFLDRPARHVIPLAPQTYGDGAPVTLSLRVLDELGMPVADGTPVTLSGRPAGITTTAPCRDGIATFHADYGVAAGTIVVSVGAFSDTVSFPAPEFQGSLGLSVRDARTNIPIPRSVAFSNSFGSLRGNERGNIMLPRGAEKDSFIVSAPGYRPAVVRGADLPERFPSVSLAPVFEGVLIGRRIAIDPGGGGSEAAGIGARGLRGASVNLAVARALRGLLEEAGAAVTLTREGEETLSAEERIYLVNRSGAELALGIRCGGTPDAFAGTRLVLHYPGSARGALAADSLAASLATLAPGAPFAVRESSGLFLQQTSCAAVEVLCGTVSDEATERLMADDAWTRSAAELMRAAIARWFAASAER